MNENAKPILVIGGGIAGMTAAVDAAEVGYPVILVEKDAYLGGRVMRTYRYFPKMCPPTCGFEINTRRIKNNPRITVHTLATVEEISGTAGNFKARLKIRPRYVRGNHYLDDSITDSLTSERPNEFNMGLDKTKALYMPHDMAYPHTYVLDRETLTEDEAAKLTDLCPPGSINLFEQEEEILVKAGAVIIATGWRPYDADKLGNLGYGQFPNVVTNAMMERYAADSGPTQGKIVRPSDGQPPKNVAFVQCAGSRDENHLPYCSAVCCMGSLKQIRYVREKAPDAKITMFYIDIRTIGREEQFYYDLLDDENVRFVKGKVAQVNEGSSPGGVTLDVQDTMTRDNIHEEYDLVVLATGVVPNGFEGELPEDPGFDDYGFIENGSAEGIYAVGCAKRPCDVSRSTKDATAAALKAIQSVQEGA